MGSCVRSPDRGSRSGLVLATVVFLLTGYAAWARGGTPAKFQPPLLMGGAVLLIILILLPLLCRRVSFPRAAWGMLQTLFRDPLFWIGSAFLALLTIQWWNSGRSLTFDSALDRWVYSPPPRPGWPSGIMRRDAFEMICWFLPAWAVTLAVRSPCMTRRHAWGLFYAMVANAVMLSAFGIWRFLSGSNTIWGDVIGDKSFATFGYINQGSTYFVLATTLTVGLFMRECFAQKRRPRRWLVGLLLAASVLCLVGVHLSFSRAGMLFAWVFVLAAGAYAIRRGRRDLTPAKQAYLAIGVGAIALTVFLTVANFADREVLDEIGANVAFVESGDGQSDLSWSRYSWGGRGHALNAAWGIWEDSPWFGVGGGGFALLLPCYIPQSLWAWASGIGRANVHNDPLQFLVEFGVVGAGLLALAVVVLCLAISRSGVWRRGVGVMVLLGCAMVWLHALIDLPFRCPAILLTWTALLASLPLVGHGAESKMHGATSVEQRA